MHETFARLVEAAAFRGASRPTDIALKLNETAQTISNWAKRGVPRDKHVSIAEQYQINPIWLATGRGEMVGPMRPTSAVAMEPSADYVPVARVELRLEAGVTGFDIQQVSDERDPIFFRRNFLDAKGWRADRLIALKIHGDSMEPALFDGDLVVVNTADTQPADGEVFAVNYEGQPVIKRLRRDVGSWWLDSDNPRHKPKRCDDAAILIGRVIYRQTEKI